MIVILILAVGAVSLVASIATVRTVLADGYRSTPAVMTRRAAGGER